MIENFDKPPLSTNCLHALYMQPAENLVLSTSSINAKNQKKQDLIFNYMNKTNL
jgi:hypothetical protein